MGVRYETTVRPISTGEGPVKLITRMGADGWFLAGELSLGGLTQYVFQREVRMVDPAPPPEAPSAELAREAVEFVRGLLDPGAPAGPWIGWMSSYEFHLRASYASKAVMERERHRLARISHLIHHPWLLGSTEG